MSIAKIEKMSTAERLTAMEQLWDALCHEEKEIVSPQWHKAVLEKRRERLSSGEARFYTMEQLKELFH